jgi:hypothetical protein
MNPFGWFPSSQDVAWTTALIERLRDGGSWVVPANGNIYTVHKAGKQVYEDANNVKDEAHYRVVKVLEVMGYSINKAAKAPATALEEYM